MTPRLFGQTVLLGPVMHRDPHIYGTLAPQLNEIALARIFYGKGFSVGFHEARDEVEKRLARLS